MIALPTLEHRRAKRIPRQTLNVGLPGIARTPDFPIEHRPYDAWVVVGVLATHAIACAAVNHLEGDGVGFEGVDLGRVVGADGDQDEVASLGQVRQVRRGAGAAVVQRAHLRAVVEQPLAQVASEETCSPVTTIRSHCIVTPLRPREPLVVPATRD